MKRILGLSCIFMLSACGTDSDGSSSGDSAAESDYTIEAEDGDATFDFRLISEKDIYQKGEKVRVKATLTNNSEKDIDIEHGGTWLWLDTKNLTENYEFQSAMEQPLITTTIESGETITHDYHFSGGSYVEGMPGEPYSDKVFTQMGTLEFPKSQYEIDAKTDFNIAGSDEKFEFTGTIGFEVTD
ncbi:hypothetical protein [Jeotgalibacillus salarius]|uniref:Uncharacterized protein n=1 Tax=Jeotgalibacillus salarius TaxID=546023 RepID=A0A4Y8LNK4_9BACL|nr:hypothetical protein [Jeotgalibacillus salarius]TFE02343.1 hypothetical protein E2626_07125 [Jeotgalibacillus salarius]